MKILKFVFCLLIICIFGCGEGEAEPVNGENETETQQVAIVGIGITEKNDPRRREIAHEVYKDIMKTLENEGKDEKGNENKGYKVRGYDPGVIEDMCPILSLGSVFVYVGHGAVKMGENPGNGSQPLVEYHGFICDTLSSVITPWSIQCYKPDEMKYKLVFIYGCFTCEQSETSQKTCSQFKEKFKSQVYVGWENEIDVGKLYYGKIFLEKLMSGSSVQEAINHVKEQMRGLEPNDRYLMQLTQDAALNSPRNNFKAYLRYVGDAKTRINLK